MIPHFMVDIETMSTLPTAAIVSIGAVRFDPRTSECGETFYQSVSLASCLQLGLSVDASTIVWWVNQSQEARAALFKDEKVIEESLWDFTKWMTDCIAQVSPDEAVKHRVWCNGPSFDGTILENAYRVCGLPIPWKYNSLRDVRTIVDLSGVNVDTIPKVGISHNALDDAIFQAKMVQAGYALLGKSHDRT
jgi:hypothetical protein